MTNTAPNPQKKIALAHDFLLAFGGAERVFQVLAEAYPEAPIYTLLSDPKLVAERFPGREIRTSFLQKFPLWLRRRHRFLLPLYPIAIETMDLREFDLVISSSGAWMKGLITRLHTRHIAYVHSPMRYVWDYHERYLKEMGRRKNILLRLILSYLRIWDRQSAERPDVLIANSRFTEERIEKYYRREAEVLSPPALRLAHMTPIVEERERTDFLIVSRLTKSKKIDMAIEAFNRLELPLVIVGTGPEEKELRKIAGKTIRFSGSLSDEELAEQYQKARVLIQPSEEDFGMVTIEAFSFGTPVIAFSRGAASELIEPGVTGELFFGTTPETLADGVRRFLSRETVYDASGLKQKAEAYAEVKFMETFTAIVARNEFHV